MHIAHTCAHCGTNLSRIRAGIDPHLRMQVVVCPECQTACVRNRDRLRRTLRKMARLRGALAMAAVRAAVTLLLLALCWGFSGALLDLHAHAPLHHVVRGALGDTAHQADQEYFVAESGRTFAVAALLAGVVVGAWHWTAFRHLRHPAVALLVFGIALLGVPAAVILADAVLRVISDSPPLTPAITGVARRAPSMSLPEALSRTHPSTLLTAGPLIALLVAFAGAPIGILLARVINARLDRAAAARRFGRLRSRLRRTRLSA